MIRIVRYFLVGGAAATVDIGLFALLAIVLKWPWVPVSIFSFVLATFVNYFLSIHFVFESSVRHKKQVEIFWVFVVSTLALIVNQIVLYAAIEIFHAPLFFAKVLSTGVVFFWNYLGRSKFIF